MPTASRPYMPGYVVMPAAGVSGLLPCSWAEDKLRARHDYWVASIWPDCRPHVMPVWGVWSRKAFWFSSAAASRKVRNLAANPHCCVAIDDAADPVVLEGVAEVRAGTQDRQEFLDAVNAKYGVKYGA